MPVLFEIILLWVLEEEGATDKTWPSIPSPYLCSPTARPLFHALFILCLMVVFTFNKDCELLQGHSWILLHFSPQKLAQS